MLTLLRVLFGFIIACLIAGAVTVAFVVTPADIAALSGPVQTERLGNAGVLALLAATHSAIFAFPFAFLAIGFAELWRVRAWLYYALVGAAISLGGLAAVYVNEVAGEPSILNQYAGLAFLSAGALGGLAYWLLAGRCAGGGRTRPDAPAPGSGDGEPAAQVT